MWLAISLSRHEKQGSVPVLETRHQMFGGAPDVGDRPPINIPASLLLLAHTGGSQLIILTPTNTGCLLGILDIVARNTDIFSVALNTSTAHNEQDQVVMKLTFHCKHNHGH